MCHSQILVFELKAVTGWDLTYGEWVLCGEKRVLKITRIAREADCGEAG